MSFECAAVYPTIFRKCFPVRGEVTALPVLLEIVRQRVEGIGKLTDRYGQLVSFFLVEVRWHGHGRNGQH